MPQNVNLIKMLNYDNEDSFDENSTQIISNDEFLEKIVKNRKKFSDFENVQNFMKPENLENLLNIKNIFKFNSEETSQFFKKRRKIYKSNKKKITKHKESQSENIKIYKPRLIRGKGKDREGKCEICEKWFKLKTSSYWYHMNYKHGINSYNKKVPEPETRTKDGLIQGFCINCRKWVDLNNKRNNRLNKFLWYKHYQKEHGKSKTI